MYGIPEHCQPLSPAEEQVLLAVWACRPPATRRDIGEKLAAKGWAPATVLNFLYRLEKKGWVKSGKDPTPTPPPLPAGPTAWPPCGNGWTPSSAATSPRPSGPSSARAAAARASWNRPWPSWPKSTLKRKNMICMTHTGKAIVNLADADHMLFVTTSNYSSGAIEYAASSGVSLINGSELLKLLSTYGFLHKNDVTIAPSEWQLTVSDLKPYVPTDIYSRFFL